MVFAIRLIESRPLPKFTVGLPAYNYPSCSWCTINWTHLAFISQLAVQAKFFCFFFKMKVPFISTMKLIHFSRFLSDLLGPVLYWLLHELQKKGQSSVLRYLTDQLKR